MTTEKSLIDSAIRGWKSNVERADKLFGGLSSEQLEQEVAPGRNRLIYLWGHLAAANDGLLPLLGIGERLGHALPIKFADVVERKVLLGNESRIKKRCHKNVMPRLHFRVAGSLQMAADGGF